MSVMNRSIEDSLQDKPNSIYIKTISNGQTGIIGYIPTFGYISAAQFVASYLAGVPIMQLSIQRFIPGAGYTNIPFGSSFTCPVFGTSGVVNITSGISLPLGASIMYLAPHDQLSYQCGGGTTVGIFDFSGCFTFRPTQDSIQYLGGLS